MSTRKHKKDFTEGDISADDLFAAALAGNYDDEAPWDAVHTLRIMGTPEIFELAKRNSTSANPKERARSLDILAQLGAGKPDAERPFKSESTSIAIRLTEDVDPLVASQAAWALAHLRGVEAESVLIAMRGNGDSKIRHAVAFGLHGAEKPVAIEALIQLMSDVDDEVRDWATFSLGSVPENDSTEIRAALTARLEDPCSDVQDEAIWGLALRHDPAALKMLLKRLEAEEYKQGDEMAAQQILGLYQAPSLDSLRAGIRKLLSA